MASSVNYDLGIVNGEVFINDDFVIANLYIKDGLIKCISKDKLQCKNYYDARGFSVMPGLIDPHVHFNLKLGATYSADDFESGSRAAAYGGVTTIIDFLEPIDEVGKLKKAFDKRLADAQDSYIDFAFHTTICNFNDNLENLCDMSKMLGIPTIKMFTTYASSDRKTSDSTIFKLIELSREKKILPIIHTENDELINELNVKVEDHSKSRPSISEISKVLTIAQYAEFLDGKVYFVHVSSGVTIEKLVEKYKETLNVNVLIESCPHYFFFDDSRYSNDDGELYTMTPPLRARNEIELLKKNIDSIDVIATDHCSFASIEKRQKTTDKIPMGIPGIETSFAVMYTLYGDKIIKNFTSVPAKIHGLYPIKGSLIPGSQADVAIFDKSYRGLIKTHYKNDYDIYSNIPVKGRFITTIQKGRFIVKDGIFLGGKGSYIGRILNNENNN